MILRTVLLIDDDPMQLRVREAILRAAEVEVCIATNGESGLAIMRTEPLASDIGVIIMDHLMPGLSGPELVREIRKVKTQVPIIVLSGLPDANTEYDGLNIIFRQKPLAPQHLIRLIRDLTTARAA